MEYVWGEEKNEANKAKHGIDFEDFEGFDEEPLVSPDTRFDYGEARFVAFGPIDGRVHCLVYTIRGDKMRLIGLRKANAKEGKLYGRAQK
jgi:uncharacterized protein